MTFHARTLLLGALLPAALAPVATVAAEDDAGSFYASLSGVHVSPSDSDFSTSDDDGNTRTGDISLENSFGLLAAVGYDAGSGLRAEMEIGYRALDADKLKDIIENGERAPDESSESDVKTLSLMLNGYYVFDQWEKVKPYIGGGVGLARHTVDTGDEKDNDTALAYQAMGGIGYGLSESTEVRLGYRYFATADGDYSFDDGFSTKASYSTHNIEAGVLFRF